MTPEGKIATFEPGIQHYTVGGSKYLRGHRLKLQADLTYEQRQETLRNPARNGWMLRFQVEIGI
jgi:phosphate-selective porin OprO and OprP